MRHIVIIESDKRVQVLLTMIFSKTNYTISFFNNEIDGILYCQKIRPDLILTSTKLMRLAIKDFLDTLKFDVLTAKIPIIVMCPKASKAELIYLIKAGVDDFILKSELMHSRLIARIEKVLLKAAKNQTVANQMQNIQIFDTSHTQGAKMIDTVPINNNQQQQSSSILSQEAINVGPKYEIEVKNEPLASTQSIEKRIRSISTAKAIPFIASEILEITSCDDTTVNDIQQLVEIDPAITAKVLRFANSAYYRRSKSKVFYLPEAIRTIGFNGIREIVLGISMLDTFSLNKDESSLDRMKLFNHSLTTSVIAREIAKMINFSNPELCFVTGLLHDIGPAILSENFSKEYNEVVKQTQSGTRSLCEIEKEILGMDHTEVAHTILTSWGFPQEIAYPIRYHHYSFDNILKLHNESRKVITILKLSCILAKSIGATTLEHDIIESIPYKVFSYLKLSKYQILEFLANVEATVNELSQILLLHGNPQDLQRKDEIKEIIVKRPYKVLFLENHKNYLTPYEVIYRNLRCEVCYADDFYHGVSQYNPKIIIANIESDHQMTVLLNEITHLSKKMPSKIQVLISTTKNIYKRYHHLKYEGNKIHFTLETSSYAEIASKIKEINEDISHLIDRKNQIKTDKIVPFKQKKQLKLSI